MAQLPQLQFDPMMNENLMAAARENSTDLLYIHIRVDPYALERIDAVPFIHTPLHVAAVVGSIRFASEIIRLKPSFALKLNEHGLSPMHLAVEISNSSLVHCFVRINKDLIRVKGKDGLTPVHLASQAGKIELLDGFLSACPESIEDVTVQSETALHVAVKHGQFEALEFLLHWLMSNCKKGASNVQNSVVNWKNEDGDTILHILVGRNDANQQIARLLIQAKINLNEKNLRKLTALDILRGQNQGDADVAKIKNILLCAKALSGDSIPCGPTIVETLVKSVICFRFFIWGNVLWKTKIKLNRLRANITDENRNILLIVAVLIATSTNQAALSPPGGVYQSEADNLNNTTVTTMETKQPGESVMDVASFHVFWAYNTVALLTSALVIYILLPPVGELRPLLIFPLLYFVVGFFFSMYVIGPPFTVLDYLYAPTILFGLTFSVIVLLKLIIKYIFRRKIRKMQPSEIEINGS